MRLPEVTSMGIMQFNQVEPLDQSETFINPGHFDRDGQILLNHTPDVIFSTPLNNGSCKFVCHWQYVVAKYLNSTYSHSKYCKTAEEPLLTGNSPAISKYIS